MYVDIMAAKAETPVDAALPFTFSDSSPASTVTEWGGAWTGHDSAQIEEEDGGLEQYPLAGLKCKAWHVVEVPSCRIVASSGYAGAPQLGKFLASTERPVASLTKLMTATIVLRKVDRGEVSLRTLLSVSERAASAKGTVAKLEPGDMLTVEQLLYALMLPSGNDAAIALAEHLGGKPRDFSRLDKSEAWPPPVGGESEQRVQEFLVEMNRVGQESGLQTFFDSPHGFSQAEGQYYRKANTASCEDLCKLCQSCFDDERLLKMCGTPSFNCVYFRGSCGVRQTKLVRRQWQNTAFLSGVEGWLGGKSGSSQDAGFCMASMVCIESRRFIGVTLGSVNRCAVRIWFDHGCRGMFRES
jgi:D-alanyl-D-alanine carboxypeptidase (penicillin-binding protein 5/6)